MNNKFSSLDCQQLTKNELFEINGGFPILVVALVILDVAVVGLAVTGAFQMGFDKGREVAKTQNS